MAGVMKLIIQAEKFLNADWSKQSEFISNTTVDSVAYLEESGISTA